MQKIIDYRTFPQRLSGQQTRWGLLDEVHAEWGFEDPGGEPLQTREGGENMAGRAAPDLPVPDALEEWWSRPANSFLFNPRLYWTHSQWPPAIAGSLPAQNPFTASDGDRRVCAFMADYEYSTCLLYTSDAADEL